MVKLAASLDDLLLLDEEPAGDRDRAVRAILDRLAERGAFDPTLVPVLHEAVIRRDELGPTGIGEGVAIPHAWHAGLDRLVAALGVSRCGIAYPSLDGAPVHLVLLVLMPPSKAFEPAKEATFDVWLRHLREPAFRAGLIRAASSEELREVLRRADADAP
jgi:mannitol/fructose-specific phosphotransferase system IIA component (Ntr-type)